MKTKIIACLLAVVVIIVAFAYTFMQPKAITSSPTTVTQPKAVMQADQQIDSAISQEMDSTLANVSQSDVEQLLLS